MSRFLQTFCKIDVSRAKSQGPDLADLMNVSAPVLISADLCRMSQLACSFLLICVECLTRWAQIITMTMIKIMNMTMTVIKIMIMTMIMLSLIHI